MRYKNFFYGFVLVFVSVGFEIHAKSENINSERDIRHEEKQGFACDNSPPDSTGACFNRDQGTIMGRPIVLFEPPSSQTNTRSNQQKYDDKGFPIPSSKDD